MLSKEALVKFVEKTYLNKNIESFVIESNEGTLITNFKSGPGFRGNVVMTNYDIGTGQIGVYYPDVLLKMLSILDSDIKIDIITDKNNNVQSLKFKDKKGKLATYATQEADTIDRPNSTKAKVSDYEVKINLNAEVIGDILKSHSVINSPTIVFSYEKGKMYAIFGYSKNNTNQIKIELECEIIEDIEVMPFSSVFLQALLSVNSKKFKTGTIEINVRGLMRVYFEDTDINSEYFLIKLDENNLDA